MSQSAFHLHRHCMVVHNYYPIGEPRVQRQAEALAEAGAEVDVICLRRPDEPTVECNGAIRIFRLPIQKDEGRGLIGHLLEYSAFFFLAMLKLTWLHLRRCYQVIQLHNLPDFLVFAAWIPRLLGASLILDLHDLMPEFFMGRFGHQVVSLPVKLVRWQEALSCRFAHHVITVSEHWRQALIGRGVPADKCSVVMNVADERFFHRPPERPYLAPVESEPFNLIYHGTLVHRYGLDLALQAIAQILCQTPDLRFHILGLGEEYEALEALRDKLGLRQVVIFHGFLPVENLPGIILEAALGLVPYRNDIFTDSLLPTKLMEYAAMGLPAIAAHTMAIKTYFADTLVEFFTPGDVDDLACCILHLYQNRSRLTELARGAEKFNRRYNWSAQSVTYLRTIGQLSNRSH